ncbi:SNF2 family DNA-dependent chromodomain-containing ATPase, partial [Aureobasidium melanogenum]
RPVAPPKPVGARESFKDLPRSDPFRARHIQHCDSCQNGTNFAPLIYCQGCVYAYHKSCIGNRGSREHLVTKVGKNDFVLQCRRCIAVPMKKDPTAPDHGRCSDCKQHGASCVPFRERKTPQQEQKDREENNGEDPIYPVPQNLINNSENVMFRCTACSRGFHFEHLPPKSDSLMDIDSDDVATQRLQDYSQDWRCKECLDCPGKVGSLVAWKPIDEDNYDPSYGYERVPEDEKAYLVRWDGKSYFQAAWMPGPWVWGTTAGVMRKAFAKRDEARQPKMRTEDAIPEDYLRIDIVLDVKYTSIVNISTEEIDKARIREVDTALVKYKGLGYEDVVWEKPPTPDDADRWTDFVVAYNDWVLGRFVKQPKPQQLKTRLEKARSLDFATKLEKKKQPSNITGGELMKYQMEGLNWLYYKWYTHKNAILADEMGLGKTIQIISFLATLVQDWNCFPFLVVVPNSTCANWRREVKQWAPSLRVVAYFGSKEARDLTYRYELFARDSKELRCHIVVTSYDCAADDSARKFFKSIPWQALIVDEGQRLKSDKSQLYSALSSLRAPFKVLLTGTPLQNNARELFNLLQFLDDTFDASQLEERFQELDQAKIQELHGIIRPFFLRRTKAQVLTFLPPMAQVIVPVSMSTVQKKLYKTILAKNPDLMRAIFQGAKELRPTERASLNNILMQLRKCLCHPFVYSTEIEERNVSQAVSHRNLVDASGKLQLLEMLLPKLKERGHRVLIFSQFLDMLTMVEDFLDGMQMRCQRLDGTISSLEKQKRIDEFNAPDSPLFAFLLSTRAGGVGINLATADTVIILDPDFNPHQDIQALSRAHRIGQKKKVLCFQIVTRASAEEKIMSYGRRKMALDHVLIEQMDAEDATDRDLEGILRHGTKELFDDDGDKDIKYDSASIDRLLEVSHIEHTKAGEDKSAESTFSFARVWANNELEETTIEGPEAAEVAPDRDVWDKILKERERIAAVEAAAAEQAFGRGRRAKATIDYGDGTNRDGPDNIEGPKGTDEGSPVRISKRAQLDEDYDTDFQADSDEESIAAEEIEDGVDPGELQISDQPKTASKLVRPPGKELSLKKTSTKPRKSPKKTKTAVSTPKKKAASTPKKKKRTVPATPGSVARRAQTPYTPTASNGMKAREAQMNMQQYGAAAATAGFIDLTADSDDDVSNIAPPTFRRVDVPTYRNYDPEFTIPASNGNPPRKPQMASCVACQHLHPLGSCPLKRAGVEYCGLCGLAHYGFSRICPHINSETQVREMIRAVKLSSEPGHLKSETLKYLTGLKGTLVQKKKKEAEKKAAAANGSANPSAGPSAVPGQQPFHMM